MELSRFLGLWKPCVKETPKASGLGEHFWCESTVAGAANRVHGRWSQQAQLLLLGLPSSCSKAMVLKGPAPAEQGCGMARGHVLLVLHGLSAWDMGKGALGLSLRGCVLSCFQTAKKGESQKPA